jgi:signal transduction histidine kinase
LAQRQCGTEPEPLTVLRREVDRMQGILEEFLNFSRPLVPLNLRTIDLSRITNEVAGMHEGLCDMRNLRVELVTHAAVEVAGDPRKIRQILVNLLQNAIEACEPGARLWLRVAISDERAEVVIEDEGKGLDPAVAGRVFEAGVTNKREGSGLGLAVARGLARQHGGDIALAERSPRGCTATLTLPRRPPVTTDGKETGT